MRFPMPLWPLIPGLVGVLVCLRLLAYASPPDPTWIGGVWDGNDYDDVIIDITTNFSGAETVPGCSVQAHWVLVSVVPLDANHSSRIRSFRGTFLGGPRSPEPFSSHRR